jgi:hypothetical protein
LRNVVKKVITFFGASPYQKGASRGCQKGMFRGFKGAVAPFIAKKILDM